MPELNDVVRAVAARLDQAGVSFGQGTLQAWDEAVWLVLWALGLPLDALDEHATRPVSAAEEQRIETLLRQRIDQRLPLAYVTGEAWLQGVPFHIDARSIIPRSLIAEVLADGTLDAFLPEEPARILDLCTGNGSLAVLAALAYPQAQVNACDLSADALAVAQRNVQRHGLQARISLWAGDLFAALPPRTHEHANETYALILCNPPYVNAGSMGSLPPEFQAEPALALAGGADGMDLVRRIVAEAGHWLTDTGVLVLEIGHEQAHFERAFPGLQPVWLPTSAGDEQVLLLTRADLVTPQPT